MATLGPHHRVALVAAVLTSSIALVDAVTAAATGSYSVFADDSDNVVALVGGDLVHAACYGALVWVLGREAARFARYGRLVRATRKILVGSLGVLCLGFAVVAPVAAVARVDLDGPAGTAWGIVATVAFFGMILSAAVLSVVVLRRNRLGVGGRVLGLLLPVAAVSVLLGVLGSPWAHPGYVETVINVGLALVGAGLGAVPALVHDRAEVTTA